MSQTLRGRIAVVTGGSRGVGKGAALGLGEAGATVYVTGRTAQQGSIASTGTITETAEAITRLGGRGIAVRCDHGDDADVEALFRRVKEEEGRLDVLVNNVFATYSGVRPAGAPFWELPLAMWDELHRVGLRSHYVASVFAAPIMIAQRHGLIANISSVGAARYTFNVPYGVGKAAVDRLTADMAHELRPHGVAVVSLWPGLVKTERVMAQPDRLPPELIARLTDAESPQFTGRAVAALAADPKIIEKTGNVYVVAELAEAYGFTDVDGRRPPLSPGIAALRASRERST